MKTLESILCKDSMTPVIQSYTQLTVTASIPYAYKETDCDQRTGSHHLVANLDKYFTSCFSMEKK